jgi:hypothetical protein
MAYRMSDVLGISNESIESMGAFDAFVDIDSKFHIDPHLLKIASTPELRHSYSKFQKYFQDIVQILRGSTIKGDRLWREACKRLIFREVPYAGLGYATKGTHGTGIGPETAKEITNTASEIIHAGILDPAIFELIGLFEEQIGADRISDMTLSIILTDILRYTERIAVCFNTCRKKHTVRGGDFELPYNKTTRKPIILIPMEILRPLPVALDWSDIDFVSSHNVDLRNRVNKTIGNTWKAATRVPKKDIKSAILDNPEILEDLLEQYKKKPPVPYDFSRDPEGEIIWSKTAQECTQSYPLDLRQFSHLTSSNAVSIVSTICKHFKKLVEDNGLFRLFYDDNGTQKKERAAQLLFFGIADAYCRANDLNLTAESNAGRGPVDFKISKGYRVSINVEIKYTTNDIIHGFNKQLPIYNKAENATHSIFLVIRITNTDDKIKRLLDLQTSVRASGQKTPDIIIVDGRIQPSASKV